ncbi:MAG TPA: ABC transporter substrate-binding protein [Ilumatobacter sp.]|nr:ABC transporter substrate-binding protein [Ilumatobacter sp.]
MIRSSRIRTAATLVTAALVFAACASDDTEGDDAVTEETDGDTATTVADGDDPATTTAEGDDTATTDGTDTTEGDDTATTMAEGDGTPAAFGGGALLPTDVEPGEVGGSACGAPYGEFEEREAAGEVRVAWNDPLLSFNNNTTHSNATANANIVYMTQTAFTYYDADLNLINNTEFGTCTLDSIDPLTITYTINEGVTWSDGVQIDAADMLLTWATASGHFNEEDICFLGDGTAIQCNDETQAWLVVTPEGETREETAEDYDAETGDLLEGYSYVPAEGVAFDAFTEGMNLISPEGVTVSEDGLSITVEYDSFYVDYPYNTLTNTVPAHVVAANALGTTDPAAGKQAIIDAFLNNDTAATGPIASFWNTGFDANSLPDDPSLYLSSGPYMVTAYEEVSQMTLEVNPDYEWGPEPHIATLIYQVIGDPAAAVQALANEEIDAFQPQATADLLTELEGYADRGIVPVPGIGATYEHVDLVHTGTVSPFSAERYDGDAETALLVRQALLKTVPRQDIIDRLIAPIDAAAQVRNSFIVDPGTPWYEDMVAQNGSADYAEQDIEGAIALLEQAGVETPIDVRVLFADNNPRRASEFELIQAAAAEAGFNLIDGRSPTWGSELGNIQDYDMNFFGWQSTSTAIGGSNANYISDGANNFYGYSNADVDALFAELNGTADPEVQKELVFEAEANLWADAFGITLFQHPGLAAYNSNYVEGIDPIALSPTLFWNVWDWTIPG